MENQIIENSTVFTQWRSVLLNELEQRVSQQLPQWHLYGLEYSNPTYYGARINIVRKARSIEEAYLVLRDYLLNNTHTTIGNSIDLIDEDVAWNFFHKEFDENCVSEYVSEIIDFRLNNDIDLKIVEVL